MQNKATVKIVWDSQSKSEKRAVRLRITFNRVPRYKAIPCDTLLTKEEFNNTNLKRTKEVLKEAKRAEECAMQICEELGANFTMAEFNRLYDERIWNKMHEPEVWDWDALLDSYFNKKELKPNTRDSYRAAVRWVVRYQPSATVSDMSESLVDELRSFMKKTHAKERGEEMSVNTIAMHFRALKAICNYAIELNLLHENPFKKPIPTALRQKRAVPLSEWLKFVNFVPEKGSRMEFAQNFALLSFAMSGANMADILAIKNRNVLNDRISFTRKKTERVDSNVAIPLAISTKKLIVENNGILNPNKPNSYVFPFYRADMSEKTLKNTRSRILKKINKGISEICDAIGIETFTTYNIRHTYVSLMISKGTTAEQMMPILGHKNVETTKVYFNTVANQVLDVASNLIDDVLGRTE